MTPPVLRCARCGRIQNPDVVLDPEGEYGVPCDCGSTVFAARFEIEAPSAAEKYTIGIDPAEPDPRDGVLWADLEPCTACDSSGIESGPMCSTCKGDGYLEGPIELLRDDRGTVETWGREECQDCAGSGFEAGPMHEGGVHALESPCSTCGGSGTVANPTNS